MTFYPTESLLDPSCKYKSSPLRRGAFAISIYMIREITASAARIVGIAVTAP